MPVYPPKDREMFAQFITSQFIVDKDFAMRGSTNNLHRVAAQRSKLCSDVLRNAPRQLRFWNSLAPHQRETLDDLVYFRGRILSNAASYSSVCYSNTISCLDNLKYNCFTQVFGPCEERLQLKGESINHQPANYRTDMELNATYTEVTPEGNFDDALMDDLCVDEDKPPYEETSNTKSLTRQALTCALANFAFSMSSSCISELAGSYAKSIGANHRNYELVAQFALTTLIGTVQFLAEASAATFLWQIAVPLAILGAQEAVSRYLASNERLNQYFADNSWKLFALMQIFTFGRSAMVTGLYRAAESYVVDTMVGVGASTVGSLAGHALGKFTGKYFFWQTPRPTDENQQALAPDRSAESQPTRTQSHCKHHVKHHGRHHGKHHVKSW